MHGIYMRIERRLASACDLMLFESGYIASRYREAVGEPPRLSRVVLNGIADDEFEAVAPAAGAADFLYVGELRAAKGIDVLLEAMAATCRLTGRRLTAVLVGSGPDRQVLEARARALGLGSQVTLPGPMRARDAFRLGRLLIVPSRAESLPYVVLEAAGGQLPMVATHVGGIPEIFGPYRDRLVAPGEVAPLTRRMMEVLAAPEAETRDEARRLAIHVRAQFGIRQMVDGVMAAYREAIASTSQARGAAPFRLRPDPRFGS